MDRAITQPVGDLGKVHVIIADHLLGGINFQPDKLTNYFLSASIKCTCATASYYDDAFA